MSQLAFPSNVTPQEIAREPTLGGAINLCAKAAGLTPKEVQDGLKADRAQYSRWTDDKEGIVWSKVVGLMDLCGNDAPLLWMLHQRGYDLGSLRKRETETERENRLLRERIQQLEHEREVERRLFRELRSAA
jgi:plasmid maintenance system antidote protein VapI